MTEPTNEILKEIADMVKTKQNKKRGGEEFQDLELREIQELINRRRLDGGEFFRIQCQMMMKM